MLLVRNVLRKFCFSLAENERKLDPLPEEKVSQNEVTPRRTPMKWKPSNTIEITDVVGTIEAIQGEIEYSLISVCT